MSRKSRDARAGWLMRQDGGSFSRTYAVLKGRELSLYASDARVRLQGGVGGVGLIAADVLDNVASLCGPMACD